MPTPPVTDTNEYHIDSNITEYTPLTVPIKWNSCDVENALSLQENMNREDRLVASRYILLSVSVMRDRDIAPVVEILETCYIQQNIQLSINLSSENNNNTTKYSFFTLLLKEVLFSQWFIKFTLFLN